ncbi:hypothetical protein OKA04_06715 [Luteolibacter flavescens]|uniref:DNA 3'-5' helicase II n=1 Tax=Luteolibacter flavescens TaxID=1859460 RepID=A0ABT3FLH2_9BACT|nr:UvrD-helicase domain-containing protein [Luteolibacter flavescens]MCW1884417.1 hypothetical protein [Luteolibacter flavescens]
MARIIPDQLRGKPGSPLHLFRKVLKKLPDDFTAWFSMEADDGSRPQVFLVWRERYAFLIQVADTSQKMVEAALQRDFFAEDQVIEPEDIGSGERELLEKFVELASGEFGPLEGKLPVKTLVVFPNVEERTIDEVMLMRGDESTGYLGLNQMAPTHFERRLEALAQSTLTEPGIWHMRRIFTPESVVPDDFSARRPADRNIGAAIGGGFLDFDQEWCVKNDLELLPEQEEIVHGKANKTKLVTGVAGSGKSLVLLYRALLSAKLHPRARVLVLTHNKPLRHELERRSAKLSGKRAALDCLTFFQWAGRCLNRDFGSKEFPWGPDQTVKLVSEMRAGRKRLDRFSSAYLVDEIGWIKDHRLLERQAYLDADRAGRGTMMTAGQREDLWELFREYQHELDRRGLTDWHNVALRFHREAVVEKTVKLQTYDAIFIDEAQFFAKLWFEVVLAGLKPGGHLFLAADPTQGFLRRRQSWLAAGIDVRGGRTTKLAKAYRNTRAILRFARDFYQERCGDDPRETDLNVPDDAMLAEIPEDGEAPLVIRVANAQDEIACATNQAAELLGSGLAPGSLLILHADGPKEWALRHALERKLGKDKIRDAKSGPRPSEAFCSVTTLNAATGLEAPVVMLLGMDALLEREGDPRLSAEESAELKNDATRQLYMGFTRAGQRLIVIRTA